MTFVTKYILLLFLLALGIANKFNKKSDENRPLTHSIPSGKGNTLVSEPAFFVVLEE
jgi:hypothetical protein